MRLLLFLVPAAALRVAPSLGRRSLLALAPALSAPRPAAASIVSDDKGRFVLSLPEGFVQSKRSASTGTLFVAGNFPRAAVLSVTGWPVSQLLEADAADRSLPGLPATPILPASPAALQDVGSAQDVARLLLRARDREASAGALSSELLEASFDADGCLRFSFLTPLPVADPDELERQRGVRELKRRSSAVALLRTLGTGNGVLTQPAVVSAWGSALAQDWDADLGRSLEDSVSTFRWN